MEIVAVIGALFVFQSMITICFGRIFRGTREIKSDEAVSAETERWSQSERTELKSRGSNY